MPVGIFPVGLRMQRYYRRIGRVSDCFSLIRFNSVSYSFVTQLLSKYSVNLVFFVYRCLVENFMFFCFFFCFRKTLFPLRFNPVQRKEVDIWGKQSYP